MGRGARNPKDLLDLEVMRRPAPPHTPASPQHDEPEPEEVECYELRFRLTRDDDEGGLWSCSITDDITGASWFADFEGYLMTSTLSFALGEVIEAIHAKQVRSAKRLEFEPDRKVEDRKVEEP